MGMLIGENGGRIQPVQLMQAVTLFGKTRATRSSVRQLGIGYSIFRVHPSSPLCAQLSNGAMVNFIFGEGVSPTFRALRDGLDELGLPSDELLNYGSREIAYGGSLTANALEHLLGMEAEPRYYFPPSSGYRRLALF